MTTSLSFFSLRSRLNKLERLFVPGKPFKLNLMFASQASGYSADLAGLPETNTPEAIFLVICDPSMNEL